MGRKKSNKKNPGSNRLSPENYIRQRARSLPIHECRINKNWKETGEASILLSRKHVNGNFTYAMYLVDLYCMGITDTIYQFNVLPHDYSQAVSQIMGSPSGTVNADYPLIHNIIYGAEDFAKDFGFSSHKDFKRVTRYLLEEDTEEVERVDIEFGKNGRPYLILTKEEKHSGWIRLLERTAGPGNFDVLYLENESGTLDPQSRDTLPDDPLIKIEDVDLWTDGDWEDFKNGKNEMPDEVVEYLSDVLFTASFPDEEKTRTEREVEQMFQLRMTTEDYTELDHYQQYGQDHRVMELLDMAVGALSTSKSKYSWKIMKELIREFPDNPMILSTLLAMYQMSGKNRKWQELVIYAYQRFPGYFFIQINYLELLIHIKKFAEFEKIIDNKWSLATRFPERDVFTNVEVFRFYNALAIYFGMKGSKLLCAKITEKLRDIVPEDMLKHMDALEHYVKDLKEDHVYDLLENPEKIREINLRQIKINI